MEYTRLVARLLGASLLAAFGLFLNDATPPHIVVYAALGAVFGDLVSECRSKRKARMLAQTLEFALPMAMERVVMAVGSGLDILPALSEVARRSTDPVSELFRRVVSLSEGGMRVEHALQIVADGSPSSSVKHALVHLGLAYKQGGEVIRPLKELSDATQTHYQEGVEEEIAKLPVKAVLPLILTFTGLIICFLTVPIVQVGDSLERFSHVAK
jgi:Flp pilus assembly protein TadB